MRTVWLVLVIGAVATAFATIVGLGIAARAASHPRSAPAVHPASTGRTLEGMVGPLPPRFGVVR